MKYSIIIPAYNEEARLENTVTDYAEYVKNSLPPDSTEILLIVNGSGDRTDEIARELEKRYSFVKAWISPERMGKGGAVLQGFTLAQGEILAFSDADNATVASELHKLLDAVDNGADAAIGSRWLPESKQVIPQPWTRRLASRVFNLLVRILFQFNYKDTQCGAKAFRKQPLLEVKDEIRTTGWAFDVALIWKLRSRGYKVIEVPITWSDNSASRLRMHKDAPSMLVEMLKLRFGK